MGPGRVGGRYWTRPAPIEVDFVYPQILIPIFMLFVAVLAYGWFYWQHAKARGAASKPEAPSPPVER